MLDSPRRLRGVVSPMSSVFLVQLESVPRLMCLPLCISPLPLNFHLLGYLIRGRKELLTRLDSQCFNGLLDSQEGVFLGQLP